MRAAVVRVHPTQPKSKVELSRMAKVKGSPKTGGRQKGTPNKSTQSILDLCEAMDFSPIEAMLKLAQQGEKDMIKEVCQYIYPKRKSLEHSGSLDPKMMEAAEEVAALNKEQQIELLETELKKLKGE